MRASYSRDTAAAGTRVPHWVPMPKSTKKKGRRSLAAPASAPADLDEDGKPKPITTVVVKPDGTKLSIIHDKFKETRAQRRAREQLEAKQAAAQKRRQTRSSTGLCGAVLRGANGVPQSGTGGTKPSVRGLLSSPAQLQRLRQQQREPDLRQVLSPTLAELGVGDGSPDRRPWDGSSDPERARVIIRSRMCRAPPIPGAHDHAAWSTKSGARLRPLLMMMGGSVSEAALTSAVKGNKDYSAQDVLRSRLQLMGGLDNVDPEDVSSIEKLCENLRVDEPDEEGRIESIPLSPERLQAAVELYANERAMDELMGWLLQPVSEEEISLLNKLTDADQIRKLCTQAQILRLRLKALGGIDSLNPHDEERLRDLLVDLPINIRFLQAAIEKRYQDISLAIGEGKNIERMSRLRIEKGNEDTVPFVDRATPEKTVDREPEPEPEPEPESEPETEPEPPQFRSVLALKGNTAVEKLQQLRDERGASMPRKRDLYGLDVLERTSQEQVLDLLAALQPPEMMEDVERLSLSPEELRLVLEPHELAVFHHAPSPRAQSTRKMVAEKTALLAKTSYLPGIHPCDTETLEVLAEAEFWPIELMRAGFVYVWCARCARQSGVASYSRECMAQMARINEALVCETKDSVAIRSVEEKKAQAMLDYYARGEARDGGPNAPWPYELQSLVRLPDCAEALANEGIHSLEDWDRKTADPMGVPYGHLKQVVSNLDESTEALKARKRRYCYMVTELISRLKRPDQYEGIWMTRVSKLAEERRGTWPKYPGPQKKAGEVDEPYDFKPNYYCAKEVGFQWFKYADMMEVLNHGPPMGADWVDAVEDTLNFDRICLWTPGIVSAWMMQTNIDGLEPACAWVLQNHCDGRALLDIAQDIATSKLQDPPWGVTDATSLELFQQLANACSEALQLDSSSVLEAGLIDAPAERELRQAKILLASKEFLAATTQAKAKKAIAAAAAAEEKLDEMAALAGDHAPPLKQPEDSRAVLQGLKKSQLRKHAVKLGVDEDELDDTYDAEDTKVALIDLILKYEARVDQLNSAAARVEQLAMDQARAEGPESVASMPDHRTCFATDTC